MNPFALIGGLISAMLGAVAWGLLTWATQWEIGYLAWAIGGIVGFGVARLGGRGPTMAVMAALLAALSIFGGKMLAIRIMAGKGLEAQQNAEELREAYEELKSDAEDFTKLASDDEHREFMTTHGYTKARNAQAVREDELVLFREETVPSLKHFAQENPDFETWRQEHFNLLARVLNNPEFLAQGAFANLGIIDGLFMLFGIGTAFRVVAAAGNTAARRAMSPGPPAGQPETRLDA